MANYLNPFSGRQFLDANGAPYSGAKLFVYSAGTSTKVTTYKDSAGASSHANPIVLNTKGEPADGAGASQAIWQAGSTEVKLVLAPANDTDPPVSAISTWDNISGINDVSSVIDEWIVGPTPTYVSATSFTLAGDVSTTFHIGRRIKTTNSGGTIYSTITDVAYTTLTTVTVANDSGTLDSGLSAVSYGLLSSDDSSSPGYVKHQLTFTKASPFVFEGTTADAFETTLAITDPTADRTITVPDATGTESLADPVVGSAKSLKITNNATNPNYQLDVTADAVVMENSSSVSLKLATWSLTVDITASGANGLDTGAEANSTWYYIWAIYDGTNKRGLISASATAPTMPAGYTYKALIGAWYNDSGGNLVGGVQFGKEFYYKAGQVVLNAGTATTETSVSLSTVVPPVTVSEVAFLHTYQVGTDASAGVDARLDIRFITGTNYVTNIHKSTAGGGSSTVTNELTIPLVTDSYYYILTITQGSSVSTTHRLLGFRIK